MEKNNSVTFIGLTPAQANMMAEWFEDQGEQSMASWFDEHKVEPFYADMAHPDGHKTVLPNGNVIVRNHSQSDDFTVVELPHEVIHSPDELPPRGEQVLLEVDGKWYKGYFDYVLHGAYAKCGRETICVATGSVWTEPTTLVKPTAWTSMLNTTVVREPE